MDARRQRTRLAVILSSALLLPVMSGQQNDPAPGERRDMLIQPISLPRKQALIIGNTAYPNSPLINPVNDAAAMEVTLKKLGFEVRSYRDLGLREMEKRSTISPLA
jgi:hypothetical protein